jgi:hypothetical protein
MLVSSGRDSPVRLWEVATGKEIREFAGHDGIVSSLSWCPDGKKLATAGYDTTALIWAISDPPDEPPTRLGSSDLQSCWTDLSHNDPVKAHASMCALLKSPRSSVPFLAKRLQPVPPPNSKRLTRLLEHLDDEQFAVRHNASEELEQLGEVAEATLRQALGKKPSLEARRRLEELLAKLDSWSGERLRAQRTTTVLEHIGTAEARQILEKLAKGAPEAQWTIEAKASLKRLAERVILEN